MKYYFSVDRFRGHSDSLAGNLELFGIYVKRYPGHRPCILWRDHDGDLLRDIGQLIYVEDGANAGHVHVWPFTDATDEERVILLRKAEKVIGDPTELAGDWWNTRRTKGGVTLRETNICTVLEDGCGCDVLQALTAVPEGAWTRFHEATDLAQDIAAEGS